MTEPTVHTATLANMRRCEAAGIKAVAFSPDTYEQYSATPGDYWDMPDDQALQDAEGQDMILVTFRTVIDPVSL